MNCIDSLRSERRFRQITRIKVKDLSLSHLESQYQKLLTAHAFEAVQNEIRRQQNTSRMSTEEDKCDCAFYRCMKLPCRHIFKLLNDRGQDLYVPQLVAERWTQQYNSILNVAYRQGTVTASVGTPVRERTVLTANQKFRKASVKLQKLASVMSNNGMDSFMHKMSFIDELLSFWEADKTCTLVETITVEEHNSTTHEVIASGDMEPAEAVDNTTEQITSGDTSDMIL